MRILWEELENVDQSVAPLNCKLEHFSLQKNLVSAVVLFVNVHLIWKYENQFYFQANCNVDATTFDGNTPLHLASGIGLKGQTALLVAAGADTTLHNSDEETAFDLANVAEVSELICV